MKQFGNNFCWTNFYKNKKKHEELKNKNSFFSSKCFFPKKCLNIFSSDSNNVQTKCNYEQYTRLFLWNSLKNLFQPHVSTPVAPRPTLSSSLDYKNELVRNNNTHLYLHNTFSSKNHTQTIEINFWKMLKCARTCVKKSQKVPEKHRWESVTHFYGWFWWFRARITREMR